MVASGGVLSEGCGHGGSAVCLGDGQTDAEGVPSQGGRGDALLRRMPPYLTWLISEDPLYVIQYLTLEGQLPVSGPQYPTLEYDLQVSGPNTDEYCSGKFSVIMSEKLTQLMTTDIEKIV